MKCKRSSDGRAIDHHSLQVMRQQAIKAMREGQSAASVAAAFGVNVRSVYRWLADFANGGQNALLAYMIAPIFYYAMILGGFTFYERIGDASAAAGIARSLLFAAVVLGIAAYGTARGVRLRL